MHQWRVKRLTIFWVTFSIILTFFVYSLPVLFSDYDFVRCTDEQWKWSTQQSKCRRIVNPPQRKGKGFRRDLNALSDIVQYQLHQIQNQNCDSNETITLSCGSKYDCGLGCQIHHRLVCLIVSYVMQIPLINYEDKSNWNYYKSWNSVFHPLGSKCLPGNNTFYFKWVLGWPVIHRAKPCFLCSDTPDQIEYPLKHGIPVAGDLAEQVESLHPHPFQWWIGQFLKFALRLSPSTQRDIDRVKQSANWTQPIVGLHVRRTDKITEAVDSVHDISVYMKHANDYYDKLMNTSTIFKNPKRIFVASDDPHVTQTIIKEYQTPEWSIIGFPLEKKYREDTLEETVRDLILLSSCDYVICGYSSNLCRLVQEMLFINHPKAFNKLHSLDGQYSYVIWGHRFSETILKVFQK